MWPGGKQKQGSAVEPAELSDGHVTETTVRQRIQTPLTPKVTAPVLLAAAAPCGSDVLRFIWFSSVIYQLIKSKADSFIILRRWRNLIRFDLLHVLLLGPRQKLRNRVAKAELTLNTISTRVAALLVAAAANQPRTDLLLPFTPSRRGASRVHGRRRGRHARQPPWPPRWRASRAWPSGTARGSR